MVTTFLTIALFQLSSKQPVIIYLHPGGFIGGTGNSLWLGPQYFLDHDIVLVTTNYRLGPLGNIFTDCNWKLALIFS